jgi:hypothetical protein
MKASGESHLTAALPPGKQAHRTNWIRNWVGPRAGLGVCGRGEKSLTPALESNSDINIQGVPGGNFNILGGHSIGHCKQDSVYVHVFYSEIFPAQSYFTVQLQNS